MPPTRCRFTPARSWLGLAAQNAAAAIRLHAERGLGLLLAPIEMRGRPKNVPAANNFKLTDLGVSRRLSHQAQKIAAVPQVVFDACLEDAIGRRREITTSALLRAGERLTSTERNRKRICGGAVTDLVSFAAAGNRFIRSQGCRHWLNIARAARCFLWRRYRPVPIKLRPSFPDRAPPYG